VSTVLKSGSLNLLETSGPVLACNGIALPFTTNEDIATKFEADVPHCVRNVKEKNILLFKFRCKIFIGVRISKEMPGSVTSGTPCIKCILTNMKKYERKERSPVQISLLNLHWC
jgi:hypothetical protein